MSGYTKIVVPWGVIYAKNALEVLRNLRTCWPGVRVRVEDA